MRLLACCQLLRIGLPHDYDFDFMAAKKESGFRSKTGFYLLEPEAGNQFLLEFLC